MSEGGRLALVEVVVEIAARAPTRRLTPRTMMSCQKASTPSDQETVSVGKIDTLFTSREAAGQQLAFGCCSSSSCWQDVWLKKGPFAFWFMVA